MIGGMVPLVPAALQAQLHRVHLAARWHVHARGSGHHASRERGGTNEFVEYRAYQPGDDPRHIDWKLYARSDRLHVRDAEQEGPLAIWLIVDCSASMQQSDPADSQDTKLARARMLAASLVEVALRQGDRFGLIGIGTNGLQVTALGSGRGHRDRCMQALRELEAEGVMPDVRHLSGVARHVEAGALAIVIGDGFDDNLAELIRQLAHAQRDVVALNLLTAQECELPGTGLYRLQDPETGIQRVIDLAAVRPGYLKRFNAHRKALSRLLDQAGVRHLEHRLDEPPEQPLLGLFGAVHSR